MTQHLLVPLRGGDRLEEILPYVQDVAQPGMTVVFLVHFGVNRFKELAGQLLTINSDLRVELDPSNDPDRLSGVEKSIHNAAAKLRQRGVAANVKFYSGSLRRLVRQCTENEPVKWVIMRPARSRLRHWCHSVAAALRLGGRPTPAPVLLIDPDSVVQR